MTSPRVWIEAARPKTLVAAVVPVAVGAGVAHAHGGLRWLPTLVALASAVWIQIGTNFANDVYDFERGADTEDRVGPTRLVATGVLSPEQVRRAMFLSFGLAFAGGLYLTRVAGWPILVIGIVSILAGYAYTGGPFPLGYHGLGDAFVMIFFGFVAVCGTVWVNLLAVPELAWWASLPPGALATAILVVNNVRDVDGDRRAGKRTLAVRLGRRAGIGEYVLLLLVAFAVPAWLAWSGLASPWVLLSLAVVPSAGRAALELARREGRELNPLLGATARILLLHGLLFATGLALGGAPPGEGLLGAVCFR